MTLPFSPPPGRRTQRDRLIAALVFLAALLLYLPTVSPSVVVDDGGEIQMLSHVLGVAHPTGYPLMLLLGWVFSHLPVGGDVAWRVTLLSTVASAGAIAALYLLGRQLGAEKTPAAVAALMLAAAPRLWMHAQATEVYGLANLLMVLGVWLLLRWGAGRAPLWWATLAFGLGLTHHISLRLVGPPALLYVLLVDPRLILQPRRWLPALAALLAPLLLYALIPLRAAFFESLPQLQGSILGLHKALAAGFVSPHYYGGFWNLALALDYGQQFLGAKDFLGLSVLDDYLRFTLQQAPWPAVLLAVLGVFVLWRRDRKASLFLLAAYALSLWAALRFLAQVGEDGDNFIPVYLLMAAWLAVGADAVWRWGERLWPPWGRRALLVALWLLPLVHALSQFPAALERRQVDVRPQAGAILAMDLPEGAAILGEWRDITALRYLQRVEGLRPDLWIIHAGPEGIRLLQPRAEQEGVPLAILRPTPAGLRLLPLPAPGPTAIAHADERRLNQAVRWLGYDLPSTSARPGETLPLTFYWAADAAPPADWTTFIHLLDAGGEKVAQVDRVPVGVFYPPTLWRPGQMLADQYELTLPPDLPPGRYRLIFGAYSGDQRFQWADGRGEQELAEIIVAE